MTTQSSVQLIPHVPQRAACVCGLSNFGRPFGGLVQPRTRSFKVCVKVHGRPRCKLQGSAWPTPSAFPSVLHASAGLAALGGHLEVLYGFGCKVSRRARKCKAVRVANYWAESSLTSPCSRRRCIRVRIYRSEIWGNMTHKAPLPSFMSCRGLRDIYRCVSWTFSPSE